MTRWMMRVLVACVCVVAWVTDARAAGASCDGDCLKKTLDQYLNAVIKHDPSAAPLFVAFRQTENAVVVGLGTGVWKTLTGLGQIQRTYIDAVSGQVGYFGIVEEGAGNAEVVTVRLKVDDRKVTEAEWIIARKDGYGPNGPGGALLNPDSLMANPPPERTMARGGRPSREALVAVANSYFDGLTTHDGSVIMHHAGCTRIENGTVMTGRARGAGPGGDCAANLENLNVSIVADRRYPIVDEEAGVVLGMVVFMRKAGTPQRRNMLSEWFFIDDHKIRTIYAAMFYPPPEMPVPNWPPFNGNFPLPSTFVAPAAPAR